MRHTTHIDRNDLFEFPWTEKDNPGGWIEVTDICNLRCPGCFRHTLAGHRPLHALKQEVIQLKQITNCSRISIAGGEPLLYPGIADIVEFIAKNKLKAIILTNGELLTEEKIKDLDRAGLYQFYFHVDANQNRPGWTGKSELEMNRLRQQYVDLVNRYSNIKCGFLTTVTPQTLQSIPDVAHWFHENPGKVVHVAFIAFRGIPISSQYEYFVNGKAVDPNMLPNKCDDASDIEISTEGMYRVIKNHFKTINPSAYLKGTSKEDTYKFLIINTISSKSQVFGSVGRTTIALQQFLHRKLNGHYSDTIPDIGKEIFLLAVIDKRVRNALIKFVKAGFRKPRTIFEKVSLQSIVLQQPYEIIDGNSNLCEGCVNMMMYNGQLINSCRLDEYRMLGGTLTIQPKQKTSVHEY